MDFAFASAQDIIRANQKDAFIDIQLREQIREVVQWLKGVRFVHGYAMEIDTFASFLYLGLTTLVGTRTLGEEYTDLIYLTSDRKLPSWQRKAMFVLSSSLGPLLFKKLLAKQRAKFLAKLEEDSWLYSLVEQIDLSTFSAINLTLFYFAGSYYQLSKRIFGLRYASGHRVNPLELSGSYEFLGILLVIKALGKMVRKVNAHISRDIQNEEKTDSPSELDLEDETILPFIPPEARSCNLCLESVKVPTVTLCGHMFCWSCITEWCRDNSECPLCRQNCEEQNLLVLQA